MSEGQDDKGGLVRQILTFLKEKPTTEMLLIVIVIGLGYGAGKGVPYVLEKIDGMVLKMDVTVDKIEKSHVDQISAVTKELTATFKEQKAEDRAEAKADREEKARWLKSISDRIDRNHSSVTKTGIGADRPDSVPMPDGGGE